MTDLGELFDLLLRLFLAAAQQVLDLGGFGFRQSGKAQGRLANFRQRLLFGRLGNLSRSRWVGPFIKQTRSIFGFAFKRGGKILAGDTGLWAALTKAFEVCDGFGSGGNGGESGRLQWGIGPGHWLCGGRRRQGIEQSPYDQRFAYQTHRLQIPFRLYLPSQLLPTQPCHAIKRYGFNRFKFAENSIGLISQLLTLARQLTVNSSGMRQSGTTLAEQFRSLRKWRSPSWSQGQVVARVKDVLDDGWKIKPLSMLLLLCAGTLSTMIVYNALAKQPVGARLAIAAAPAVPGVAPQPVTTVVLKYDPLIQDAQRELLALGVYKGAVDGVNGLRTKQAIETYQQMNGLTATGEVSDDLVTHMRFTHKVQAASEFTGSVAPAAAPTAQLPLNVVAAVQQPAKPAIDQNIKKVQVALAGLGYDINKLDGLLNDETHSAILKYQMDNGLDMSGEVDPELLQTLKVK